MEFEELKKVWDTQNNEQIYIINEKAMYNHIHQKKRSAAHIAGFTEWLSIIVNLAGGCFILISDFFSTSENLFLYLSAAWMFITAAYVLVSRVRRLLGEQKFDRSMQGELHHAIAIATYQVRFSQLMRLNIFPISFLIVMSVWSGGKSMALAVGFIVFIALAFYVSGWEHRYYKSRKRDLEGLAQKLSLT